jgi:hypothetical protein
MHNIEDLETLHREANATPVEKLAEPGGGHVVRLTDPYRFTVEAIFGMEQLEPIDMNGLKLFDILRITICEGQ